MKLSNKNVFVKKINSASTTSNYLLFVILRMYK